MKLTSLVLPIIIVAVLACAYLKKVDIMGEFSKGALEGIETAKKLLPTLAILITAVGMFRSSGALEVLTSVLSPFLNKIGIPSEVMPLMLLKPFSGSGSIAIIQDIFSNYGTDSFIGRVASTIAGSTETTFYTVALYFGAVGVSKTRHTIPSALAADFTGFFLSVFFVKLFFYGL